MNAENNSLIGILHQQVAANNRKDAEGRDCCKIYPSSIGKCKRAIVYQMLGYEAKTMEPRIQLICENGNFYHERAQGMFGDAGILLAPELSIKVPELRLSGRTDALIRNFLPHTSSSEIIRIVNRVKDAEGNEVEQLVYEGPDNDVAIVELKSISDSGFKYISKKGPKEMHVMQLMLYLHLFGVKQGILLYENKNDQDMKEFFIGYDPVMSSRIMQKMYDINDCVDKKNLPIKEYDRTDNECQYCDYFDICWPTRSSRTIQDLM